MRSINLALRAFSSNHSLDPYKLTFAVTYRCNSRCKICNIWKKNSKNELSLSEIDKIFSNYNRFCWVDLTGGEIFLRKDIANIAEIIIKKCKNLYILHFPTNGLMTEKIVDSAKKILALKPRKMIVTVSLDGPKKINDRIRGIKGDFEKALKTFSELKKLGGLDVFLGFTLSEYNAGHFNEMFAEVKKRLPEITAEDFHMNIAHESSHYYDNSNIKTEPKKQAIAEIQSFIRNNKKISPVSYMERKYWKLMDKYLETKKTPLDCKAVGASIFLDPYGFVYPCSVMDIRLGSLRQNDYDFGKILQSDGARKTLEKIKSKECDQCWTPCEAYPAILGSLASFK